MSERKRGVPYPNGAEREEAQLVGPYPTWGGWKHVVEDYCKISFRNGAESAEPLLHKFYTFRRLCQKAGRIDREGIETFWQEAEEEMPGFGDRYERVIDFIVRKTPVEPKF